MKFRNLPASLLEDCCQPEAHLRHPPTPNPTTKLLAMSPSCDTVNKTMFLFFLEMFRAWWDPAARRRHGSVILFVHSVVRMFIHVLNSKRLSELHSFGWLPQICAVSSCARICFYKNETKFKINPYKNFSCSNDFTPDCGCRKYFCFTIRLQNEGRWNGVRLAV